MALAAIAFYLLAAVTLVSAFLVVIGRNPVHSVLFLILAFFNAAGLFLLLGAEFLAMILVVVYVGAVAVLFLFVVMMLDIDFTALRQNIHRNLALGLTVGLVLLSELVIVVLNSPALARKAALSNPSAAWSDNTQALGLLIYTKYLYAFQISGLILLVAMIGAIVLTLRHKEGVKRQNIADQVARTPATGVELRKVPSRAGL